jgi:glycosyltransferase involved in cell wall biosynthesis
MKNIYFFGEKRPCQLTVVIPMFNVVCYVHETLYSMLNNHPEHLQLIIVDDGSTDDSFMVAKQFLEKYSNKINSVLIKQNNKGLGASRNIGLTYATGEYVTFLDSDDFILPAGYMSCLDQMDRKTDLVIFRASSFDQKTLKQWDFNDYMFWDVFMKDKKLAITSVNSTPEVLSVEPSSCIKLYKLTWFLENKFQFPENIFFEDCCLHFQSLLTAKSITLINQKIYMYRVNRPGKITEQKSDSRFDMLKIANMCLDENQSLTCSTKMVLLIHLIIRMSFWCSKFIVYNKRIMFYEQLSTIITENCSKQFINNFIRSPLIPVAHRYVMYLLKQRDFNGLLRLSGNASNLIKLVLFCSKHLSPREFFSLIKTKLVR